MNYSLAAGSIVGRNHLGKGNLLVGKNNQDAFCHAVSPNCIIGVVCDGCGSSEHAEVGANIGAKATVSKIQDFYKLDPSCDFEDVFPEIESQLLDDYSSAIKSMNGNFIDVIMEYFLFTTLGFIMTPTTTTFFYIGDGIYFVNGQSHILGPYPGNAPPFIAYQLVPPTLMSPRDDLHFITQSYSTEDINNLLIGTDGVVDLMNASRKNIPGKDEKVGDISQFWLESLYFDNNDAIRRKLSLVNREYNDIEEIQGKQFKVNKPGLLKDDTTMVTLRRRNGNG